MRHGAYAAPGSHHNGLMRSFSEAHGGKGMKTEIYKREFDAYYTIEASFIVPAAVFILVFVIHSAFMMYARCVIAQDNYLVAMRASILREGEDRGGFASSNAPEQFGSKYFGNDRPTLSVSAGDKSVRTESETVTHRTGFDMTDMWEEWRVKTSAEAMVINAPAHIRELTRIRDAAESVLRRMGTQ